MDHIFVSIYLLFSKINKLFLLFSLMLFIFLGVYSLQHFKSSNNANDLLPNSEATAQYQALFKSQSLASNFIVGVADSNLTNAEKVIDLLVNFLQSEFTNTFENIKFQNDLEQSAQLIQLTNQGAQFLFQNNKSILNKAQGLDTSYFLGIKNQLSLPNSYFQRLLYKNDPFQIQQQQYLQFQSLRNQSFSSINDHIYNKDGRICLAIIQFKKDLAPAQMNEVIEKTTVYLEKMQNQQSFTPYFIGAPYVSYINQKQVIKDIILSASIGLFLLSLLLISYFRKASYLILLFLPVILGILISIGFLSLMKIEISLLSIGLGSIVSGLALDYSFHFFTALKHQKNLTKVLQEISKPLILGSLTTVLAFFALMFTQNKVLQDFGLFVSIALLGTLISLLVIIPQWIAFFPQSWYTPANDKQHWLDRFANASFWNKTKVALTVVVLFVLALITFKPPLYNGDLNDLYYQTTLIKESEKNILPRGKYKEVYLIQKGDLNTLLKHEQLAKNLFQDSLFFGLSNWIAPSEQWMSNQTTLQQVNQLYEAKNTLARANGIKFPHPKYLKFENIEEWLKALQEQGFLEGLYQKDSIGNTQLMATVKWHQDSIASFPGQQLNDLGISYYSNFDLKNKVDELIDQDFSKISWISFLLVFLSLLLVYGEIELTFITIIPMASSWLMILMLSHWFNIPFNPVNIVVSAFIFGLGDDFAIFISDGLLKKYRYKNLNLSSYKSGIMLSALSSIIAIGALTVCDYPAMKSIGQISLLGLVIVLINSFTLQPFLFNLLIQKRQDKGFAPYTWQALFFTLISFSYFLIGCLIILILSPLTYLKKGESYWFHKMIQVYSWTVVYLNFHSKKDIRNLKRFQQREPGIIIANHQSLIDILLVLSLDPKIVMMTNQWVWNSPIFGFIIQRAGFLYNEQGFEEHVRKAQNLIDQGYSIMIFPEGTRSVDGQFNRFKSGAAHLAQALKVDVYPICIHGLNHIVTKGDFMVQKGRAILDLMPVSQYASHQNLSPLQWTRELQKEIKSKHLELIDTWEKGAYFTKKVQNAYVFKGPIIKWYVKVKIWMENHFNFIKKHIPKEAIIYDLGCGYGYLSYFLKLESSKRTIYASDVDQEKISLAQNTYLGPQINFTVKAAKDFIMETNETVQVVILKDMLHYLPLEEQKELLQKIIRGSKKGDLLILRDSFKEDEIKKKRNHWIEKMSIGIGFNQIQENVEFPSKEDLLVLMHQNDFDITDQDFSAGSGNTTYIFKKK